MGMTIVFDEESSGPIIRQPESLDEYRSESQIETQKDITEPRRTSRVPRSPERWYDSLQVVTQELFVHRDNNHTDDPTSHEESI